MTAPRTAGEAATPGRWAAARGRVRAHVAGLRTRGIWAALLGLAMFVGLGGWMVVDSVVTQVALATHGVEGTAYVQGREYHRRGPDELRIGITGVDDGRWRELRHWDGRATAGSTIDVVYDPRDPDRVRQAGVLDWGWFETAGTVFFVGSLVLGPTIVAESCRELARRRRRGA